MMRNLLLAPTVLVTGLVLEGATGLAQQGTPGQGQQVGLGQGMMNWPMSWPMMMACGIFALLVLTFVVLGIAAIIKYLRQ